MASTIFTHNAFDADSNGQAGSGGVNDVQVSTTLDGSGPAETLSTGDTAFITFTGGSTIEYIYTGSLDSGGLTGSVFTEAASPEVTLILANEPLGDGIFYTTDTSGMLPVCFAAGTLIATLGGERTVETLKIGDMITTAEGKTVAVKWLGKQTVHKLFTPAERFVPVRVSAGALGDGLPHTDLVLTAGHALIIDDFAIDAGALVNGTTITYDPIESLPERVTYYHIETDAHDIVMANGAPAETFVDHAGRRVFDNFAEYVALYGDERAIYEMDLARVSAARLVPPHIKARLATALSA